MRCKACDTLLSDAESVLKDKKTGEYYDLCGNCLQASFEALEDLEQDWSVTITQDLDSAYLD